MALLQLCRHSFDGWAEAWRLAKRQRMGLPAGASALAAADATDAVGSAALAADEATGTAPEATGSAAGAAVTAGAGVAAAGGGVAGALLAAATGCVP